MKLKHLLSCLPVICVGALQAQLTNAILPATGQTISYTANTNATAYNPGPAGNGVTWNFASLTGGGTYTATFFAGNQNPSGLTCAGSTLAEADYQSSVITATANYQANANTYQNTCSNVPSQQLSYTYSNYFKVFDFPAALGDSVYDVFNGIGDYGGTPLVTNGYSSYKVDGLGTLVLSSGTYSNVYRVHRRTKQYVMIDPDLSEDTLNITTGDIYEFYRPGSNLTLLVLRSQTQEVPLTGQSVTGHNFVQQDGLNSISEHLLAGPIELYPNPANGNANLAISLKQPADVSYHVMDAQGREIRSYSEPNASGSKNYSIDLNGLSAGLYVVRYGVNGQYQSSKLFVK